MSNYTGYIYLTTNLLNGKIYVGMHRVKNDRKDDAYIGSGVALKRAIEKYGLSNFSNEGGSNNEYQFQTNYRF